MGSRLVWILLSFGIALAAAVSLAASQGAAAGHPGDPSAYDSCGARLYEHFGLDPAARFARYDARPDALGWSGGGSFA